ncbi:hypothetical protein HJG60_011365 [Phyllostomus discolor]|uniref:Uncharacterized protein n=1 Tax=Phyllostomus discolor TaxID=89673 RepID=A0A834A7S5_9CHIR|nr:hypothetical protein HJG60_011365 [Phyllostomus discolor]
MASCLYQRGCYLKILFIYFQREGEGGKKRRKETSMCERNFDGLPLACPHLGAWPATQACALTGNRTSNRQPFCSQASTQSTGPHQSGQMLLFKHHHSPALINQNDKLGSVPFNVWKTGHIHSSLLTQLPPVTVLPKLWE